MSAGQSHTLYFPVYFVHIVWLVVDSHESVESSDLQLDIVVIMLLIVPMSRLICKYFQTLTTCCLQKCPGEMFFLLRMNAVIHAVSFMKRNQSFLRVIIFMGGLYFITHFYPMHLVALSWCNVGGWAGAGGPTVHFT